MLDHMGIYVKRADVSFPFYRAVLGVDVEKNEFDGFSFCVIEHDQGNGGCLVPAGDQITSTGGILLYMNVEGRIRDAVRKVEALGGREADWSRRPRRCGLGVRIGRTSCVNALTRATRAR